MSPLVLLGTAVRALLANALRSLLTMLGIIMGVAAVSIMVAVSDGAQKRLEDQIKVLGANVLLVLSGTHSSGGARMGAQSGTPLSELDAQAIASQIQEVQAVAPSSRITAQVVFGNANWQTQIMGITPTYSEVRDWPILEGRAIEAADIQSSAKVALVGTTAALRIFGLQDPLGQTIRVRQVPLTVVGLMSPKGQNALGQDQDDVIAVPLTTFRNRIAGVTQGDLKRVGVIHVKVRDDHDMSAAKVAIEDLLRQRRRLQPDEDNDFDVRNLGEMVKAREATSAVMQTLLACIAAVSLVVGGIGIMNIMLVSVTERTREIGLRMALGARSRDILRQFLTEAVLLCVVGGALGVLLGLLVAWAATYWTQWPVMLNVKVLFLAVGFSVAIGVIFGYYPARRAAQLSPIAALRFD